MWWSELLSVPMERWLLHAALLLFLLAYALRDMLWLRIVIASGYVIYIGIVAMRGAGYEVLPWYAIFLLINSVPAAIVGHERWLRRLTPAEERLRQVAFPALDPVVVKRMMRLGEWRQLSAGFALTTEGRPSLRFYLISEGRVEVSLAGRRVTELGDGQFVGEIGFIGNRPATATATAIATSAAGAGAADPAASVRCLVWNVAKLRRQMDRDGDLRAAVYAAVGSDLAAKIANQTVSASQGARTEAAQPARPESPADREVTVGVVPSAETATAAGTDAPGEAVASGAASAPAEASAPAAAATPAEVSVPAEAATPADASPHTGTAAGAGATDRAGDSPIPRRPVESGRR
jgi:CRP-like cAMP-binding protein